MLWWRVFCFKWTKLNSLYTTQSLFIPELSFPLSKLLQFLVTSHGLWRIQRTTLKFGLFALSSLLQLKFVAHTHTQCHKWELVSTTGNAKRPWDINWVEYGDWVFFCWQISLDNLRGWDVLEFSVLGVHNSFIVGILLLLYYFQYISQEQNIFIPLNSIYLPSEGNKKLIKLQ